MNERWQYVGSVTPNDPTVILNGHVETPVPVDELPGEPSRGTLVAVLKDPATGLRWAMLYA